MDVGRGRRLVSKQTDTESYQEETEALQRQENARVGLDQGADDRGVNKVGVGSGRSWSQKV